MSTQEEEFTSLVVVDFQVKYGGRVVFMAAHDLVAFTVTRW